MREWFFSVAKDFRIEDKPLEDGFYEVDLFVSDKAGNRTSAPTVQAVRDTEKKSLTISTNKRIISAKTSFLDPLYIITGGSQTGLKETVLEIKDKEGNSVKSEYIPYFSAYAWNMRSSKNELVKDGTYYAQLPLHITTASVLQQKQTILL